jgi:hypothetical protein
MPLRRISNPLSGYGKGKIGMSVNTGIVGIGTTVGVASSVLQMIGLVMQILSAVEVLVTVGVAVTVGVVVAVAVTDGVVVTVAVTLGVAVTVAVVVAVVVAVPVVVRVTVIVGVSVPAVPVPPGTGLPDVRPWMNAASPVWGDHESLAPAAAGANPSHLSPWRLQKKSAPGQVAAAVAMATGAPPQ